MAANDAILPEEAVIYIADSSTAPASAATTTYGVTAEITNFSESGGEEDVESRSVFGGGNIDLVKPRTQIEVSFDVILRYGSSADAMLKWDEFKWGDHNGSTVSSAGDAQEKAIYIQFSDGTLYYTRAYRNAKGVAFEPESAADDLLKGTMTFKLSPTDADGNANFKAGNIAASSISWS